MPADPSQPTASSELRLRVVAKRAVAESVVSLTLARPDDGRLPDWAPGAHLDLVLPNHLTRQYSLCGDRWDPQHYRIAVLREPDGTGGSAYVHDTLAVGDLVGVGGPRNNFDLVPAERYLFVAGGIGSPPLLAMVRQAEMIGADWRLLYGGRRRASMGFLDELAAYGDRVRLVPQDEEGPLDLDGALVDLGDPEDGARVYVCGPGPLLDAVEERCAGWTAGVLRTERFVAAEQRAHRCATNPSRSSWARSGLALTVTPGRTVLDAVLEAGVSVLSSCRRGVCGTCETGILDGLPDHRDSILDDDERSTNDAMFICVSRSCGDRLTLDL